MDGYESWYARVSGPFRGGAWRAAINGADKALVVLFACAFAVALAVLAIGQDLRALRFALVPAIVFVLVTVLRIAINAPRPYEQFAIDPLVHKDTKGKSMPSRHMASAVVIACALAWLNVGFGVAAFLLCGAIAFTRIVGGVHFPRDIAVAAAIALAIGIVGFFVIP
ncbi:MAG: phosphatase PAP2 family protein [Eggerthellaceae bacterium]|nr:phosphatase PAP2 family protein [Eggerthellaceae bacterium]